MKPGPPSVLDPIDRVSEVLFGLIMVLTFTGSLSVADAGREMSADADRRARLQRRLGHHRWDVVSDGLPRGQGPSLTTYLAVRKATDPQEAQRLIADALPPVVASILEPAELETMRRRMMQLPEPPERARLSKDEWPGSIGVFLIVFVSTFPVVSRSFSCGTSDRPSCVQCHRHRDVVSDGLRLRNNKRPSPVAGGSCDGRARVHARRHDHGAGRIVTCDYWPSLTIAIALLNDAIFAQAPANGPIAEDDDHAAGSRRPGVVLLCVCLHVCRPGRPRIVQPTFTADRGWLHLEARYKLGGRDSSWPARRPWGRATTVSVRTGSGWPGREYLAPTMAGRAEPPCIAGRAYKGSLSWRKLEFSSEGEYAWTAEVSGQLFVRRGWAVHVEWI